MAFIRVKTGEAVKWSDESLFQGALVLTARLPADYEALYARTSSGTRMMPRPLPQRMAIPIIKGQLVNNSVVPNADLAPPNTRYVSTWHDSEGKQIGDDSALFVIPADADYEITVPALTVPIAPV